MLFLPLAGQRIDPLKMLVIRKYLGTGRNKKVIITKSRQRK